MSSGDRRARQRVIRELIARRPIGSQAALATALLERGFVVTQATVSRDIAELGLVKMPRAEGHVYVAPEDLAAPATANGLAGGPTGAASGPVEPNPDARLARILGDVPVTIARSGLILVLTGTPGTASVVAQAIDDSSLRDQVGTLAGDNTTLVLFADETHLVRWLERFEAIRAAGSAPTGGPIAMEAART
jgi:transcriptional regulator of arginine metabolism